MPKPTSGQMVRQARTSLGLSRRTLAHTAGVSERTIVRVEMEDHIPNGKAMAAIAQALGISVDDVLARAVA